jgi:outer membrane lipoprotein-sorting protein
MAQFAAGAEPGLAGINYNTKHIMKLLPLAILRVATVALSLASLPPSSGAADPDPTTMSAKDLSGSLSALQDGASYVRLRLEVKQPGDTIKIALQLQIKKRRTKSTTDVVYQVLWPKERKGEAVLLHQTDGSPPTGWFFIPPDKPRPLKSSQMADTLFASDLSYEDVIENFFGWENQAIVGNEVLNRVNCLILESKPDKSEVSNYARVRSWIDPRRLVPLRVEKYLPSGQLARRIDTTRVATDDKGRPIPADLTVRGLQGDSVTDLDGSRIRHEVVYTDREFTPEGLTEVQAPPSVSE